MTYTNANRGEYIGGPDAALKEMMNNQISVISANNRRYAMNEVHGLQFQNAHEGTWFNFTQGTSKPEDFVNQTFYKFKEIDKNKSPKMAELEAKLDPLVNRFCRDHPQIKQMVQILLEIVDEKIEKAVDKIVLDNDLGMVEDETEEDD